MLTVQFLSPRTGWVSIMILDSSLEIECGIWARQREASTWWIYGAIQEQWDIYICQVCTLLFRLRLTHPPLRHVRTCRQNIYFLPISKWYIHKFLWLNHDGRVCWNKYIVSMSYWATLSVLNMSLMYEGKTWKRLCWLLTCWNITAVAHSSAYFNNQWW